MGANGRLNSKHIALGEMMTKKIFKKNCGALKKKTKVMS
jgi:hypothetical protein